MICGIAFTSGYILYFQFLGGTADPLFLGITPEGIGFVGMIINFVVSFAVSLFTAEMPDNVKEIVDDIDVPSAAGKASNHDFDI